MRLKHSPTHTGKHTHEPLRKMGRRIVLIELRPVLVSSQESTQRETRGSGLPPKRR
jgi:hypothetical protein